MTLQTLADSFTKMSADEKKATIKKTNGIFLLNVKSSAGKEATWTIDLKKDGDVVKGAKGKPGEYRRRLLMVSGRDSPKLTMPRPM